MPNVTVYVVTNWQNLPTQTTPINASNLNHLENGVKALNDFINTINAESGLYLCATPFLNTDRTKLDSIEAQANKYVLPTASESVLGGVKVDGTTITIQNGIISSAASATTLSGLTDTNITDLANGQILTYDASSGKWKNATLQIATALSSLTDVVLSNLSDGQVLKYDAATGKWVNGTASTVGDLNDLTDVNITSPAEGDTLRYDGSDWVNVEGVEILDYEDTLEVLGLPSNPRYAYRALIPVMTSNTTPRGVASASSVAGNNYAAYKAFIQQDASDYDRWVSAVNQQNSYIEYDFENPVCIQKFEFKSRPYSRKTGDTALDSQIIFQGSNDGITFTDLGTYNITAEEADKVVKYYVENNTTLYRHYRIQFLDYNVQNSANKYCGLTLLQMYERYLT